MKKKIITLMAIGLATVLGAQAALICDLDATVPDSVVTVGGVATDWIDQSGNGNNAGDLNRIGDPVFPSTSLSASGLAGVDMLSTRTGYRLFSATEQDSLLDFSGAASGNSGLAVLVAVKVDGLTGAARDSVFGNHGNAATAASFGLRYEGGQPKVFIGGTVYSKSGTPIVAGDTIVMAFNYNKATGAFELWDSKNASSLTGNKTAANFSSTQDLYLGTTANGGQYMNGSIGEVLVYDEVLDATTFSNKCVELADKWTVATGIQTPSGLSAVGVDSAVVLDWLDDGTGFVDFYTIYRGIASGANNYVALSNVTESAFVDTDVVNGFSYYYALTATDTNGFETGFSGEVPAAPITVLTNLVLYQHLDATVGGSVTTDGLGEVSAWADQSGNGNDASAGPGDPVLYPSSSLSAEGLAGMDVRTTRATLALFAAADVAQIMDFTGAAAANGGFAVLVAFKADNILTNLERDIVIGNASSISSGFMMRYDQGVMQAYLGGTPIVKGALTNVEAGDTIVYAFKYTASTGEMVFWDSKNDDESTATTAIAGNFKTLDDLRLAGSNNSGQYMDGMIGEVQIYTSVLSDTEFQNRRTALATKWGTALANGYSVWETQWDVSLGSETDDYDSDGLNNLVEYAMGGNPTNGTVAPAYMPTSSLVDMGSSNVLEYVYTRRDPVPNGLAYDLNLTPGLFFPKWTNTGFIVVGEADGDSGFKVVTNQTPVDVDSKFIKLVIEQN